LRQGNISPSTLQPTPNNLSFQLLILALLKWVARLGCPSATLSALALNNSLKSTLFAHHGIQTIGFPTSPAKTPSYEY
jgi:hypothetical protein